MPAAKDFKLLRTSKLDYKKTIKHKVTLDDDGYNSPDEFAHPELIHESMKSRGLGEADIDVTFSLGLGLQLNDDMVVTGVSTKGLAANQATLWDGTTHRPIEKGDKLVGIDGKLFDTKLKSARDQLEERVTESVNDDGVCVLNFNGVYVVPRREVPEEARGEASPVRDFFAFLIFVALIVLLPAILLSLFGEGKEPTPLKECEAPYNNVMANLEAKYNVLNQSDAGSAGTKEMSDLIKSIEGKKICVDKTNPATYLIPFCNLTDPGAIEQYMGWGEVLPSVVFLIFISFLLPKMKDYCFRPDPKEGIFDKMIKQIIDGLPEEPESDFERELNDALEETKKDLKSEISAMKSAVQHMSKKKKDGSSTVEDLIKALLSLCSDGILFASIFAGIYWGYSAEEGSRIALDNHNGNCWFMQTAAFPFTVPLIIPIVKLIIKGYDRLAYVVKAEGQAGTKQEDKVTSLSTTYFKLEAEIEKYREVEGNEAPGLIKMIPVTALDIVIFSYAKLKKASPIPLPSLPNSVMTKTRYSAVYKDGNAPDPNGHKTDKILDWVSTHRLSKRDHDVHPIFKRMQRYERRALAFLASAWGFVLSFYLLPLFIVFIFGALFPTLLNQFVFAVYAAMVLYSAVVIAEMFFEALYQTVKGRALTVVEDKFYIRDKFFRSRPLYLLLPVVSLLVILLLVPPIIMMGKFYFTPLDSSTQKYKDVTSLLMEFNDNLWAWKTLFDVSFPFPDLENFFKIDFWNGLKELQTMSFVLGILALIIDLFADIGVPVFFDGFRLVAELGTASEAAESVSALNKTRKDFIKAKNNARVLALYAQKLKQDAEKGSKKKSGKPSDSVKFNNVQQQLEKA